MTSGYNNSRVKPNRLLWGIKRPRIATLIFLSFLTFIGVVTWGWFSGEATISNLFAQLHFWQENPPFWLEVPGETTKALLSLTVILWLTTLAVIKISPQPKVWSRVIVVALLLALTMRYLLWRGLSSLNLEDPLSGLFSITLFSLEILLIFGSSIQLFLAVHSKQRKQEADQMSVAVLNGEYSPSVDILIPTYNEGVAILRRTIIGCQALEYPHKKISVLDDSKRPEIKKLARELGCRYLTRPDNSFAKAGNLNHGIHHTSGELIVVFDADFVPTQDFLTRTVGFFQNSNTALVQTHQEFYNPDPFAYNLGLEKDLNHPIEELFSRYNQPLRDGANSTLCYGSSFVVRRSHLEEVGGFYTASLSEDYYTAIRLLAQHYDVIYLDEHLSAGLAPENVAASMIQRQRWARGTIQAFFVDASPLTIPGLKIRQRLAYLEGILAWFGSSLSRIGFFIIALSFPFLGILPIRATVDEWLYFFLPYYIVNLTVFSWLNRRSCSAFLLDIYSTVLCFTVATTVIQTLFRPFSQGFKVTPKGLSNSRFQFNVFFLSPLIVLFGITLIALGRSLWMYWGNGSELPVSSVPNQELTRGFSLMVIWSCYNLFILGVSILAMIDAPRPKTDSEFEIKRVIKLGISGNIFWGVTRKISEFCAEIEVNQSLSKTQDRLQFEPELPVNLEMVEEELNLQGVIISQSIQNESLKLNVMFKNLTLVQQRKLVEMLFCRPGQWKPHQTPGELRMLGLLVKALLKPKFLFDRYRTTIKG